MTVSVRDLIYCYALILGLGNDRGMGNTMCFWPGVCWGTGAVLWFDTHTLTITLRGFYVVFGHTPDGVEARKFEPHTIPVLSSSITHFLLPLHLPWPHPN